MGAPNLIFLISCILLNLPLNTAQICSDSGNFTSNSTYGENRNQILSSLPYNVTTNNGFFTASLTQDSETVYVLALCRGDISNDSCFDCVNYTSRAMLMNCPNQKEATNYGHYASKCIVRCSNVLFFDIMETQPPRYIYITSDITYSVDEFDQALNSLVESLIIRAAMGSSTIKFATGEGKFGGYLKIYGLMQCIPGIASVDCSRCLRGAVDEYRSCCFRKRGANVLRPSCMFLYDLIPFFESSAGAAPPPPPPSPLLTFAPPPSTNVTTKEGSKSSKFQTTIIIVVLVSIFLVFVGLACACFLLRKREIVKERLDSGRPFNSAWRRAAGKLFRVSNQCGAHHAGEDASQSLSLDSLRFEFSTIRAVTNDFSNANMLGHGGFGSVYKGKLANGQEIAVKRLDGCSEQGEGEFKNEIVLMARLQHRNLVRLLGFCFEGKERLLIYEFQPNASLDRFIFDPIKRLLLNWDTRYKIIVGIARGLVYLHQDSQLRIIHHDLKAGNVLLDGEMNPKIADFGMARLFVVDQSKGVTKRIVGTFGYMPPEYAKFGRFSVKTDVFSFGVLILEIVSGKKYSGYGGPEHVEHLISYAWKKWRQGKASRLIDETLVDGSKSEKMRCIHIGLLCVQENVAKRPTMAAVVLMLNGFSMSLPLPSKPGFFVGSSTEPDTALGNRFPPVTSWHHSQEQPVNVSVNEASITDPYPR
ncbi:cysteine-rich receptor-like protein kinase 26 isoform X2 [Rhododendron vialii]|uniref:cysteine-rich receptor-like protein kinase 26 isoform X2 n=1 Tax=Rhododendron vialii TaxID=182163 RepID=UPI00265DD31E|nr:cysteine-rich receptor-like protein kinase 26 isoform X2 [Rhododendron vialii]